MQTDAKGPLQSGPAAMKLRVIAVPIAFNEDKKIGLVIDRFNRSDVDEIMVIDDGSTDRTAEVIRSRGVSLLSQPERGGVGK